MELIAETGSGVPLGCFKFPFAKERAENPDDEAEVGPLVLLSIIPKLSDLEWALSSLAPLAELPP